MTKASFLLSVVVAVLVVILFSHWLILGVVALSGYSIGRLHGGHKAKKQLKVEKTHTLTSEGA